MKTPTEDEALDELTAQLAVMAHELARPITKAVLKKCQDLTDNEPQAAALTIGALVAATAAAATAMKVPRKSLIAALDDFLEVYSVRQAMIDSQDEGHMQKGGDA
jgi:hypothetical protein